MIDELVILTFCFNFLLGMVAAAVAILLNAGKHFTLPDYMM